MDRWTTEETITGRLSIPEGLVVLRELKQLPNPSDQITTVRAIAPNGQLRYVQQPDYNRRVLTARDREPYPSMEIASTWSAAAGTARGSGFARNT